MCRTRQIPMRVALQHFIVGNEPALYLSAMCFPLEAFVKLARLDQLEDCGPNDPAMLTAVPCEKSQYLSEDRRVVIHLEQAPTDFSFHPQRHLASVQKQHDVTRYLIVPKNGFKATSVAMTFIFEDPRYQHSGRHKHLEAMIYILEGEGYNEVQGRDEQWGAGDVLHVPRRCSSTSTSTIALMWSSNCVFNSASASGSPISGPKATPRNGSTMS